MQQSWNKCSSSSHQNPVTCCVSMGKAFLLGPASLPYQFHRHSRAELLGIHLYYRSFLSPSSAEALLSSSLCLICTCSLDCPHLPSFMQSEDVLIICLIRKMWEGRRNISKQNHAKYEGYKTLNLPPHDINSENRLSDESCIDSRWQTCTMIIL